MKFAVIGLGSMGKRRVRCLHHLEHQDVIGFDNRQDRRVEAEKKYGIETVESLQEVWNRDPDALLISVPPDVHMKYAHEAAAKDVPFFIEASVTKTNLPELITKLEGKDLVAAPSCTMRYHPAIKIIKQVIEKGTLGKLSNYFYISGQYLPDWHPWEKPSEFYVSKKETGGGREIVPFEYTWLAWVFDFPQKVVGMYDQTVELEPGVEIDDTYNCLFHYPDHFMGVLTVDVVSRLATRRFLLNGDKAQLRWDWEDSHVELFHGGSGEKEVIEYSTAAAASDYNPNITEQMYYDEIDNFIRAVEGKEAFLNTLEEDLKVLEVLYAVERSFDTGKIQDFEG